jgi:hypothetical protein
MAGKQGNRNRVPSGKKQKPRAKAKKSTSVVSRKKRATKQLPNTMLSQVPTIARNVISSVGSLITSISGHGDYQIKSNSVLNQTPNFGSQNMRLKCTEQIATIKGTSAFTISLSAFGLNPAIKTLFPWLCQLAFAYDEFEWHGLVFHYKPISGMLTGSNTALGSVMMGVQYNPYSPAPTTKEQMYTMLGAVSTTPDQPALLGVECDRSDSQIKIFSINFGTGDTRFGCLGNFYIATQGCPTNDIGELFVTYDITLMKKNNKQLRPAWHFKIDSTVASNLPFGTSQLVAEAGSQDHVQGVFTIPKGSNTINFIASGKYRIEWYYAAGTVDSTHIWTGTPSGGASFMNLEDSSSSPLQHSFGPSSAHEYYTWDVIVSGSGVFTLTNGSFSPTSLTLADLKISEISYTS